MKRCFTGLGLAILIAGLLPGQTTNTSQPADPAARFELADVHESASGTQPFFSYLPGRLEVRAQTMLDLISQAYQMDPSMVLGGPAWLNTDKYDVVGKFSSTPVSDEATQMMMRNLLADRFKLVARKENRDMPVYILTVSKKGAKLAAAAKDGPAKFHSGTSDPVLNNHVVCESYKMSDLAEMLPQWARNFVEHPAVDETGLTGAYDFELQWMGRGVYNRAKANADGPPAVGVFDALDKIGLKLDPGKRPLPVLVVDSVNESPTPNAPGLSIPKPSYPTEFDVAEVRPAKNPPPVDSGPYGTINFRRAEVEIMGATLKAMIAVAFDFPIERITGTPKWMDEDRFDVIAKAPGNAPFEALQVMLKNVLIERFKLEAHNQDQSMPVFVLLSGKKSKLKESDGNARSDCKVVTRETQVNGILACSNTSMAQLAERLPNYAGAYIHPPLLDLTGLKGSYDFELSWTAKRLLPGARPSGPAESSSPAEAAVPAGDITVFEALDKQLGLKAEEQKRPIPVLVIDHANQTPSEK